jgi:hypothetical protein
VTELKRHEVELEAARADLATMLEVITEHADTMEEELHGRAGELTDKSNALEQLSNKLSKYLSPQIYDSIFHGKHDAKVASTRKKLTVFFLGHRKFHRNRRPLAVRGTDRAAEPLSHGNVTDRAGVRRHHR